MSRHRPGIAAVLFVVLLAACGSPELVTPAGTAPPTETLPPLATATPPSPTASPTAVPPIEESPPEPVVIEVPVTSLPLSGPVADSSAEVSGLAWYGDYLILLPQYPDFAGGGAFVYALPRAGILAYLDGGSAGPLVPIAVPFEAPGLAGMIPGFEGYEAIAFDGDRAYLTIEASPAGGMRGHLVAGTMAPDLGGLVVDTATVVDIPPQSDAGNKSDEALLVAGDAVVTLYEVNGANLNPAPVAHRFDTNLAPAGTLSFPNVEYRITDATALDGAGRFWASNFFFPLEQEQATDSDPLAERYGRGPTHLKSPVVERLVEFQYSEAGISLVDRPPVQLELLPLAARNWEGIARLEGRGLLLVTDQFPETILGFVPLPSAAE